MLNINWPPFTQFRCVQHAVHRLFSGFKIKVRNHTKSPELQLLFLNTYFYRWALSFLISVICFPLALNNLSVILLTEFTFLLGFSQCFASSSSQRDEGNKGGERKWGKQELKSRRTEELVLHFILSLVFLIINFAWNHCLYLLFSLCSQYLCSFPEFSPRLPSPEGRAVWFSWAPSPTTDLTAFKKMLWCYSIWAHLCICVFQTGWQKKKAPQYWWEKLFKLMVFK